MNKLKDTDDLTLIPELGRSRRDIMHTEVERTSELAQSDLNRYIQGTRTIFQGLGPDLLVTFQQRARLLCDESAEPYLKQPLELPEPETELFFDVETDPFRDICYLHGFIRRRQGDPASETYVPFFAESPTPEAEAAAFQAAWNYLKSMQPCALYYYSPYERTIWRKLQQKYPQVIEENDLEALFAHPQTIDLYLAVVKPHTEWPTHDYSIKTLAKYCGFNWRDPDPSGAASIEWYHRWIESGDLLVRSRILAYNEDDCKAMRIVLDRTKKLTVLPADRL